MKRSELTGCWNINKCTRTRVRLIVRLGAFPIDDVSATRYRLVAGRLEGVGGGSAVREHWIQIHIAVSGESRQGAINVTQLLNGLLNSGALIGCFITLSLC